MKYKCYSLRNKDSKQGGDYWHDVNFYEHLKLTSLQTSYIYLIKNFPSPQKILEAGCGVGRWVIPLAQKGYDVTGIEIHNEALEIIKKNYNSDNLKLVNGDIFRMKFADNTFDLILSLGVLEHFENQDIQNKAIIEHMRILKNNGIFFITVPHLSIIRFFTHLPFTKLLSLVRYLKSKKEYFSEYRYGISEFKKILKKNNLEIIDIVYDDFNGEYNFGLNIDYPLREFFRSKSIQYKSNKIGAKFFRILWEINPRLVSGGIGFVCKIRQNN